MQINLCLIGKKCIDYDQIEIITSKEEQINQLIKENQRLNDQIGKLNSSLSNITDDKQVLQNQLGHIQKDMDGLKSNTSRLMGENQGLEKVLNVKAELEGHKIEAAEKEEAEGGKTIRDDL